MTAMPSHARAAILFLAIATAACAPTPTPASPSAPSPAPAVAAPVAAAPQPAAPVATPAAAPAPPPAPAAPATPTKTEPRTVQTYIRVSTPRVVLSHVRVIDGTGRPAVEDRNVVVERGKIVAIDAGADVAPSDGTTVLDL